MDEEVKLGERTVSLAKRDITNGANPSPKMSKTYSFGEEYKQIFKLVWYHSQIYIFKFIFLIVIVTGVPCFKADTYATLIISSFTLLGSLFFDQLSKRKLPNKFDFSRAEKFCFIMTVYIFFLFTLSLFLLCVKEDIFPSMNADITNVNTAALALNNFFGPLDRFKWFIFWLCCSADISALVEAVVNIPEETLPSRQEKTGASETTNIGQDKK